MDDLAHRIVDIARALPVEEGVSFQLSSGTHAISIKLVKNTDGLHWLVADTLLFKQSEYRLAAMTILHTIRGSTPDISQLRMDCFDAILWESPHSHYNPYTSDSVAFGDLVRILQDPPKVAASAK